MYDCSIPSTEKEVMTVGGAEFEAQFNEGAFLMNHDEAVRMGFIHPDYEPDSVILGVEVEE